MGWKLTALAMFGEETERMSYSDTDGLKDPKWAHGFLCGWFHAQGIPPNDVRFELEQTPG